MRRAVFAMIALAWPAIASAQDRVRVGEGPFLSAGAFYIARDKGYFKKLGIDIETRRFEDGSLAVPALVAGEIDITNAPASASLFNAVAKGAPMVVILDRGNDSIERAYTSISVSTDLAAAGVSSAADFAKLKGKRIGVPALGSISQYSMARGLEKAGLDPVRDVTWIANVPMPDLMKMLGVKGIDVGVLAYQFSIYAQDNGMGPLVATGGDIEDGGQIATYAVHRDMLTKKRDVVVRWAMAYLRGIQDFNAAAGDPGAHSVEVEILARNTAVNKPDLLKRIAPHWAAVRADGVPNSRSLLATQDYWADGRFDYVKRKVTAEQLLDLSIVEEARDRLSREKPFD